MQIIEVNKYKNILSYYLSDCNNINNRIEKTKYEEIYLLDLFEHYNNCSLGITTRKKSKNKIHLYAGFNVGKLSFFGNRNFLLSGTLFNKTFGYNVNLYKEFFSINKFKKHSLLFDLGLKNLNTSGIDDTAYNVSTGTSYKIKISHSVLKMLLLYRYHYLQNNNFSTFTEIGIGLGQTVINNNSFIDISSSKKSAFKFLGEQSLVIGLGINIKKFSILARVETSNRKVDSWLPLNNHKAITLLLGYKIF